jgi:hypothetical protein
VPLGQPAVALAAGGIHTCALLADGAVRCWGDNSFGQHLGVPGPGSAAPAAPVPLGQPARALTAGSLHTCALLADGGVRCWGNTFEGQLGDGVPRPPASIVGALGSAVLLGQAARAISAGGQSTCALLADGTVRCWGFDEKGQLGDGGPVPAASSNVPAAPVALGKSARAISVGALTACALLADDTVRCWGDDQAGQLGAGGAIPGPASSGPALAVALGQPARAVTTGGLHACALLADGTLRCWGGNDAGQLGTGPGPAIATPGGAVALPAFGPVDSADMSLTAAASTATARSGQPFTVTLALANAGVDAADVTVILGLSSNVVPTSASPSQGSYAPDARRWSPGALAPGASATLTLVVTASPITAAISAEVESSTARDPDATFGGTEDARASVSVAVTPAAPGPPPKVAPQRLVLRLTPARDRRAPFRFAARGRLVIPGTAAREACAGTVTVTARRGRRAVQRRRAALRLRGEACVYEARLSFARRPAGARRLAVSARFGGNAMLRAKAAKAVTARLG